MKATNPKLWLAKIASKFAACLAMTCFFAASFAGTAPYQLLSARDPAAVLPAGGNGDSLEASVSPDGRFVVFTSAASDLVAGDNRRFNTDVFLRDRASNTTTLVSVNFSGTGGGNSHSFSLQVSTNGQYVLFESEASDLVLGDTNGNADIFMRNLQIGNTRLISKTTSGKFGYGRSYDATMTADGRYVAFVSSVSDLVSNDTNNIPDVFVRDTVANTNLLVSFGAVPGGRGMATPQITPDGRHVAFFSTATGMVPGASPSTNGHIYVRDLLNHSTTWASSNAQTIVLATFGSAPTSYSGSYHPRISTNGQYVTFKAGVKFVDNFYKTVELEAILQFDAVSGLTSIIDTNALAASPYDDDNFGPEASPDGQLVAYSRKEPGTNADFSSVYVWESQAATNILVSCNGNGVPTNTISHTPVLSGDGSYVAFLSNATNLVANVVSPGFHVYLRDLQAGTTQLVDADTNNAASADVEGTYPTLSHDGRFVVFDSPDGKLVGDDNNKALDIFLRSTVAGTNELISQRSDLVPKTGNLMTRMSSYSLSDDGRWFAFESFANDLVPDDTNNWCDVFVRDLWTAQTIRVSSDFAVVSNVIPYACYPAISGDGRYVAYIRLLYNGETSTNSRMSALNIFRFDRETGSTALVSVGVNGTASATIDCFNPVISHDGRYIAFVAASTNLTAISPANPGTLWRDMNANAPIVIGPGATVPSSFSPSMSSDGRFVAYQGNNQLRVRDTQVGADIYTNANSISTAAISPDGKRVLYNLPPSMRVDGINPRTTLMSFNTRTPVQSPRQWSGDGQHVVFVGATNLSAANNSVYLCDLVTSNITLVSFAAMTLGTPNAPSDMPVISGDGRFVAYRSSATNIVAGDTNPAPKIFLFDRLSGLNSILSAAQTDSSPFPWISAPVISAGGENVAFLSIGSDLAAPDLNRVSDAFAVRVLIRVQVAAVVAPGSATTLTWQAVAGRNYGVQYKDSLDDVQWHDLPATISVVANQGSVTVATDQPNRFYQIVETE